MPIYEYACQECESRFEKIRAIKDADAPMDCVYCQSGEIRRVVTSAFAHSSGSIVAGGKSGCAGCQGGACGGCSGTCGY